MKIELWDHGNRACTAHDIISELVRDRRWTRLLLAGDDLHACRRAPPRVATPGWAWFVAELTPPQQDAYVERLFDDESWTVQPVVKEADVVALLEAHLLATRPPTT
jgi:hypothetical protein